MYDKYGDPAIELAKEGKFLSAIKLIDEILKENPNVEFALLRKANYLFNYTNKNLLDFGDVSVDNVDEIQEKAIGIGNQLKECVNLINKVLTVNLHNEGAKSFKDLIENNSLKAVTNIVEFLKPPCKT